MYSQQIADINTPQFTKKIITPKWHYFIAMIAWNQKKFLKKIKYEFQEAGMKKLAINYYIYLIQVWKK